jgi:hypothetical protein
MSAPPRQYSKKEKHMPVVRDIALSLDIEEVLRRGRIGGRSKLRAQMVTLLCEMLDQVDASHWLEPVMAYEVYAVNGVQPDGLCLENNALLHGSLLTSVLSSAKELALAVCTIGPKLEERVTECFESDEPLRGVLLDGIGSAAMDALTQEVCRFMVHKVSSQGHQASSPLYPGMRGFPISEQWQLFQLVPAAAIGVSLTSLGVMVPRKSVSMVIGIGPRMVNWTQAEACARCNLKKTCAYSVTA